MRAKKATQQVELSNTASTPVLQDQPFQISSQHPSNLGPSHTERRSSHYTPTPKPLYGTFPLSQLKQSPLTPKQPDQNPLFASTTLVGHPGQQINPQVPSSSLGWKSPFSTAILAAPKVGKIKDLNIEAYDGTTDPDDHLATYKHLMYVPGVDDATLCKYFPATP